LRDIKNSITYLCINFPY